MNSSVSKLVNTRTHKNKNQKRKHKRAGYKTDGPFKTFQSDPTSSQTRVSLRYREDGTRNNASANSLSWRYRMNSAYDPDPALLTGALTGFQEMSNLYSQYRVTSIHVNFKAINLEAFPVTIWMNATTTDLGLNMARSTASSLIERSMARSSEASIIGSGLEKVLFSRTYSMLEVWGHQECLVATPFSSSVATNPATLTFINFGAFPTEISHSFLHGLNVSVEVIYNLVFYARQAILSDSFLKQPGLDNASRFSELSSDLAFYKEKYESMLKTLNLDEAKASLWDDGTSS